MNIKINQPAGLGDILFCLKIGRILSQGHKIYWPVIPFYSWIKDYLIFDNIFWEDIPNPHHTIDIGLASRFYPDLPIMAAKYKMVNMLYDDWQEYLTFKRNHEKENQLYNALVKEEPYCLISDTFGPEGHQNRYVPFHDKMANVKIEVIDKYSPFDWCKIIENASELRLVDTSFTYIAEVLSLKAEKIELYSRHRVGFQTDYLWKKPWTYIN